MGISPRGAAESTARRGISMDKLFNLDNPVMQALARIADVMIVNLCALIFFVPLLLVLLGLGSLGSVPGLVIMAAMFAAALPIGPALTAMHYVSLKMVRNEDSYTFRSFFKSYKDNFRQSIAIWAIFLLFFVFAFYDVYVLLHDSTNLFPSWMNYLILMVLFLLWCVFLWVFPVEARFVNTVSGTIRNAMVMTIAAFPRTLGMLALSLLPFLLLYVAGDKLMPILILFGLAGPAYGQAKLYSPFFKRFEPKDETEENPDAMPEALRDEPVREEPPVGGAAFLTMDDIEAQRAAISREVEKDGRKNAESDPSEAQADSAGNPDGNSSEDAYSGTPAVSSADKADISENEGKAHAAKETEDADIT